MGHPSYRRSIPREKVTTSRKASKPKITPADKLPAAGSIRHEVFALILGAMAIYVMAIVIRPLLPLISSDLTINPKLLGPMGSIAGEKLFELFGVAIVILPASMFLSAWRSLNNSTSMNLSFATLFTKSFWMTVSVVSLGLIFGSFSNIDYSGQFGSGLFQVASWHIGTLLTCTFAVITFFVSSCVLFDGTITGTWSRTVSLSALSIGFVFVTLPLLCYRTILICFDTIWSAIKKLYSLALDPFLLDPEETQEDPEVRKMVIKPKVRKNKIEISQADPVEDFDDVREVIVSRRSNNTQQSASKNSLKKNEEQKQSAQVYMAPPLDILSRGEISQSAEGDEELVQLSRQIEIKLKDFGILGKITEVHPGPVVTLFEFEPAPGVKVGRITALQDDLAMSIKASAVRIVAPLPKKGTVGIEVPNKHRDIVRLRDILESDLFQNSESILSIPLGKDTYGDPVVVDISTMPHLLIAGATGTGKSVCINALLLSMLYKANPNELGLILIDPKILELSVYEGIPHLKVPVVTVPKQAKAVLNWAVQEMDSRYRLMQKYGVRNIDSYNSIAKGQAAKNEKTMDVMSIEISKIDKDGEITPIGQPIDILPKIVIVIDELADLMLTVGRDIEELITRLAQKARAAGIHLILATQRPSVDVITGLIKANFPARMSFRVTSRIDSRTILDSMGAERLLGKGDMLFMLPGGQSLKRIHGAFVTDDEVQNAVKFIKNNTNPQYDEKILAVCKKALEEDDSSGFGSSDGERGQEEYDEFYDKAVELVVGKGQASTSMIQRTFRIGYNRAARIIELMEKEGVIGPMDGIKPREVLIQSTQE